MKKLLLFLILLPALLKAQDYKQMGNALQRKIAGTDTTFRFNLGSPGYWYPGNNTTLTFWYAFKNIGTTQVPIITLNGDTIGNTGSLLRLLPSGALRSDTTHYLTYGQGIPSMTGHSGQFLTNDGAVASWGTVSGINLYNSNGTSTGNRVYEGLNYGLTFYSNSDNNDFSLSPSNVSMDYYNSGNYANVALNNSGLFLQGGQAGQGGQFNINDGVNTLMNYTSGSKIAQIAIYKSGIILTDSIAKRGARYSQTYWNIGHSDPLYIPSQIDVIRLIDSLSGGVVPTVYTSNGTLTNTSRLISLTGSSFFEIGTTGATGVDLSLANTTGSAIFTNINSTSSSISSFQPNQISFSSSLNSSGGKVTKFQINNSTGTKGFIFTDQINLKDPVAAANYAANLTSLSYITKHEADSLYTASGGGVTSISVASANGFTGTSSGGSTPILTLKLDSTIFRTVANSYSLAGIQTKFNGETLQVVATRGNSFTGQIQAQTFASTGTGGSGYYDLISQSASPVSLSGHLRLYSDSVNRFSWKNSTYRRTIQVPYPSDYTIRMPYLVTGTTLEDSTHAATHYAPIGITGTVTTVSATNSQGVTTTVTNATTTPNIAIGLGNITPTTISTTIKPATIYQTAAGTAGTDSVMVKHSGGIVSAISPTYYATSASVPVGANPTGTQGLTTVNGSATTFLRSDATFPFNQALVPTNTGLWTWQFNALATTTTDAIISQNTTAAANNAQQVSPSFHLQSFGWGTTAGTSQSTDWRIYNSPSQATVPNGQINFDFSVAGGAYSNRFQMLSTGLFAANNIQLTKTNLGTTSTDGVVIQNIQAATAGTPVQVSPRINWISNVWNTTATAANNQVNWREEVRPVSGTTPTSAMFWSSSLSTTTTPSFTDIMNLTSGGTLTLTGNATALNLGATNYLTVGNAGATAGNIYIVNRLDATSSAAAFSQFAGSSTAFTRTIFYGGTSTVMTNGANYAAILDASAPITTFSSGTHTWLVNHAINSIGTVTNGGSATITNTANLWVGTPSAAGGNSYSIYSTGTNGIAGTSSGVISIVPQAAAGTYNFNLPTTAGSAGQVLTSQGGSSTAMTWGTVSATQASADLTAQSAAGNVTTFTVGASTATFNVSTYINVTAVSVDVIQGQITYTDGNNTSQTVSLANISAIGNSTYSPITIRAKNATVITVKTNLTTGAGSITFDTGARITQL